MDFIAARRNMVENQLRTNQVVDPVVISAMSEMPREAFVPKAAAGFCYIDEAVAVGDGRYMMEPMVTGRLLQAAEVMSDDVVLVVGCGTGYVSALLADMASTVVGLECDEDLAAAARNNMGEQEINTVSVVQGPLDQGYPEMAPYDVIFLNGVVSRVPDELTRQLAEGGRLVAVISEPGQVMGKGTLYTLIDGVLSRRDFFDAGTPPLPGFAPAPKFVF